jgi:hypothetical protein
VMIVQRVAVVTLSVEQRIGAVSERLIRQIAELSGCGIDERVGRR